jgi:hypothetical protein
VRKELKFVSGVAASASRLAAPQVASAHVYINVKGVRARINFNLLYGPWIKLVLLEIRAYKQRALLIKGFAETAILQAVPLYLGDLHNQIHKAP